MGAGPDNAETLPLLSNEVIAMKMYLNKTFTSLRLDKMEVWMEVNWESECDLFVMKMEPPKCVQYFPIVVQCFLVVM